MIIRMNVQNAMAAKIMGELLASGMSLSDTNIAELVDSAAAESLEEIRAVTSDKTRSEKQKIKDIKQIIKNSGIN